MGVILETSLLIGSERGTIRITQFLESLASDTVAISSVTASELLHGCHRARNTAIRVRRFAFVEALLDAIPVLPFGLAEARLHAELWADLVKRGRMIGPHDLLIAATALARGDGLATLNQQEFKRVAGLRLVPVDRFVS
ncbi:MAG: type II toxin-antitoxin system VapC family toxin [Gemmatimonadales bacterium]